MIETEVFWKQIFCIETSACDIDGTVRRPPQWFGTPIATRHRGIAPNLHPPRYAPEGLLIKGEKSVARECVGA